MGLRNELFISKQKQNQIRQNQEEISRIIKQKKFYLKHKLQYEDEKSVSKKDEIDIGDESQLQLEQQELQPVLPYDDDENADMMERLLANIPNMLNNNSFKFIPLDPSPAKLSGKGALALGAESISSPP